MVKKYSVLMSVYAKENPDFLCESMLSMYNQTVPTDDFVLVCDGPLNEDLDKVIAEMQKKFGKRMRVFRLEKNQGLGLALRFGVEKCKNELIARMDSDDIAVENRIEKELAILEKMDVDVVGSNVVEYDENMEQTFGVRKVPEKNEDIVKFAKRRNPVNHMSVCFKKSKVIDVGNYEHIPGFEDYYLWVRMIVQDCKFYNVQEPLMKVRGGVQMVRRRGGLKYLKGILEFQKILHKNKIISVFRAFINVFERLTVALAPNFLRGKLYSKVLRDSVNSQSFLLDDKENDRIKIIYIMTSCRKCGPTQQTLNIIKNLDRNVFDPILVTIYKEGSDSMLDSFIPYVVKHYNVNMNKKAIILKRNKKMRIFLEEQKPNIVHSVGVFPNYLIASVGFKNHTFTLRNYVYEDYLDKFGKIRGYILAKMQIIAIKHTSTVVSCSESLKKKYKENLNIDTTCIQNGVDLKKYITLSKLEKKSIRKKLGFSEDDFLWIYSGQFIGRKNIPFMVEGFLRFCGKKDKLILLGDGDDFIKIRAQYADKKNIIFEGDVENVVEYLNAADAYISASKSEGLPNSVLEAMACGLPVVLSDILQHREIVCANKKNGGVVFELDDIDDYVSKLKIVSGDIFKMGIIAKKNVEENFDSVIMSKKYQELYMNIVNARRITLFIGGLSGGGAERVICNLANYLCRNDYLVDLITMSNSKNPYKVDDGVRKICLLNDNERCGRVHNFLLRRKRLKQYIIKNQNIQCYITMLPITIFMLVRFKKFTKSKIIISERVDPSSYSFLKKIMMKYSAKKCDGLVVQTQKISEWYNDVAHRMVIPNAINEDVILNKKNNSSIVKKKIVAVGRLEKQKNYPMTIRAFELFNKEHPDYVLEIYGQGSQKEKLVNLANSCGLGKKIKFFGYVNNISERITGAACFVMASNYEGIPNALLEAMCLGVPCVATDCDGGGAKELIEDGKNGFLVKKGSAEQMSRKMKEIVEDDSLSKDISKNAIKLKDKLEPERIYGEWMVFIDNVTRGVY